MTDKVLNFYEPLANYYHLIFDDWDRTIERQANILDSLLAEEIQRRPLKILDCACGIGTQALGLASLAPSRCMVGGTAKAVPFPT